jgi:hypothetical protein
MSIKTVRKFEALRSAWQDARSAREAASKGTQRLSGPDGDALTLSALGSKAGSKAADAEMAALREERRALKRLAAYAIRHRDSAGSSAKSAKDKPAPAVARPRKAVKPKATGRLEPTGGKQSAKRKAARAKD